MTQEEKDLLLKDLSARLPYRVIVDYSHNAFDVRNGNYVKHGSKCILRCYLLDIFMSPRQNEKGEYIKPYLRSLSSMTDEEKSKYNFYLTRIEYAYDASLLINWLNAHHFDFRGLIPKGLAIEAPEGMYKYTNYETMSLKRLDFDNNKEICRTCMFIDEYSLNVSDEGEIPFGYDGTAVCGIYNKEKDDGESRNLFISPCWKACSKYKRCTERQADYLDIFDPKTNSIIENPHKLNYKKE